MIRTKEKKIMMIKMNVIKSGYDDDNGNVKDGNYNDTDIDYKKKQW